MKKLLSFLALLSLHTAGFAQTPYCGGQQPYNGYCSGVSGQDSAVITFIINPFEYIELHDHAIEFSNCPFVDHECSTKYYLPCTSVTSSLSAATNTASCETPKAIIGQLSCAMPCCTALGVKMGLPTRSCYDGGCYESAPGGKGCQAPGFCGEDQGPVDLTDGTAKILISCITCPFSDCNIPIQYAFCADVCATPGIFQRLLTISFIDQSPIACCGLNGCPTCP